MLVAVVLVVVVVAAVVVVVVVVSILVATTVTTPDALTLLVANARTRLPRVCAYGPGHRNTLAYDTVGFKNTRL